jgi:hypothetical protein
MPRSVAFQDNEADLLISSCFSYSKSELCLLYHLGATSTASPHSKVKETAAVVLHDGISIPPTPAAFASDETGSRR